MDDYDQKLKEYLSDIGGLDSVSFEYMELHKRDKFLKRLMFLHDFIDHLTLDELRCVEVRMNIRRQELTNEHDPDSKTHRNP